MQQFLVKYVDKIRVIKSVDENEIESLYSIEVYREAMDQFEKRYLEKRLHQNRWNKSKTADQLKYDRTVDY
jgi:DNA-binding NtrC family response regulator